MDMEYETKGHRGVDLPVFEEMLKKHENLSIVRDGYGRWTTEVLEAGWYQDRQGRLYNYDGVIWDEVPEMKLTDLEYLG